MAQDHRLFDMGGKAHRLVSGRNRRIAARWQGAEGSGNRLDGVFGIDMTEQLNLDRARSKDRRPCCAERFGRQRFDFGAGRRAEPHILVMQQPIEIASKHRIGRTGHSVIGNHGPRLDPRDRRGVPTGFPKLGSQQPQLILIVGRPRHGLHFEGVVVSFEIHPHASADHQLVQFALAKRANAACHQRIAAGPARHGLHGRKGLLTMTETDIDPHLFRFGVIGEQN